MKCFATTLVALALVAGSSAFTTQKIASSPEFSVGAQRSYTQVLNSGDGAAAAAAPTPKGGQLVAVNQNNIEFSAGTIGGAAGLFLGGPVLAALLGGTTNYLARKDVDAASDAVKGTATKGIEVYNYISKLLTDNDVSGKISSAVSSNADPDTLDSIGSTWKTVSDKADEFAVVDLAAKALGVTGDALEKIVDAALGYADDNDVYSKVKAASSEAASKAKAAVEQAAN
mmetsp:Transcript_26610/g.62294  ORF Transcript_26610/g.62294 Transcript_26610/m.62294 type:complete len:228 (-) Transcript_26610:370-1053(-)|eukprot:CAMPEP_0185799756 /NCGR_PEP_ID=MMETSP1322-20130828/506_1 /TAXON_ID=265543 /ORGANISM="Minutocellus polymorphus, Strain RCC2270" /LENGTH=227 /DNA_ID=CAMNT_0028495353 /DNA_START=79 /DNA_END=762 /DNA_ORIENTATION=-